MAAASVLRIRLAPELSLSALAYGDPTNFPVLACHGWMDNAASFQSIAPAMAAEGFYVVALDLPGHGHSDHRPPSAHYLPHEYAANFADAAVALGFNSYALCGHSLGGGIVSIVAALPDERCVGVIMLEGLGPSTRPVSDAPALFMRSLASHANASKRDGSAYDSISDAVDQRLATVARYEGNQVLSRHAAAVLVKRALVEVNEGAVTKFRFRHDRRIIGPYLSYWHEEHVQAFLGSIKCPVLAVTATQGWPRDAAVYAKRLELLRAASRSVTHVVLPGGHHHHLDPDTAPAVCEAVQRWARDVLMPEARRRAALGGAKQG